MKLLRAHTVGAAMLLGLGVLSACGSDHETTAPTVAVPTDAAHNAADVTFAEMMIPHHQQAVEMADLALDGRAADPRVLDLATRIRGAQQPEIDQMTAWLDEWGAQLSSGDDHGGGHSETSDSAMTGMMNDSEMAALTAASGAAFDRLWVVMMIRHHEGAIEMAEQHQSAGKFPATIALSKAVITAQQGEITEMEALLLELPAG
jgi:uncharacterized protein (DUF305 family)